MSELRSIIQYTDSLRSSILREKCKDVSLKDPDLPKLFEDLIALAKENSRDGITLVGLSAPQVGWAVKAYIYFDLQKKQYVKVLNPVLTYSSKESTSEWEGCASIGSGETSLFAPIKRSRSCQIRFLTPEGEEKFISVTNFQSHILQHEMDHLDGILFLDKVVDQNDILTAKELDEYAKKHSGDFPEI